MLRRDVLLSSAVCLNLRVLKLRVLKLCVLHELLSAGVIRDACGACLCCQSCCVCSGCVCVSVSWISVPGGLGHADLRDRRVPTPVSPRLHGGARVEQCHGLARERASVHRASCKTYTTA